MNSPFYQPFKDTGYPVLVLTNQLDELILTQAQNYKDFEFVNVEQADVEAIRKQAGKEQQSVSSRLPDEDVTNFCLWLKDTLSHKVEKVKLSQRLTDLPAILIGKMSSQMFMMMQIMQMQSAGGGNPSNMEYPKDLTLEINAAHPTIVNLNILRKQQPDFAKEISFVLLDQILQASNIPSEPKEQAGRHQSTIEGFLDEALVSRTSARRAQVKEDIPEAVVIEDASQNGDS